MLVNLTPVHFCQQFNLFPLLLLLYSALLSMKITVFVSDDNFDDDGYNYYDDPPTYVEETTQQALTEKTSTAEKSSTTQNNDAFKVSTSDRPTTSIYTDKGATSVQNNTDKPSSSNGRQQAAEKSSSLSVSNKGNKTPTKRLVTKPMEQVC